VTVTTDTTLDGGPEARAAAYLAEVRSHLGGLADDERDDLLDDLTAHVHQIAAEDERPLAESLAPPEDFARELLVAAGLSPDTAPDRPGLHDRARAWAAARLEPARSHPWGRAVAEFLPELRPAWWVARGWLAVYGLTLVLGDGTTDSFPFPEAFNSWFLGGLLAVVGAVLSVRLGRRTPRPRGMWALNAFAIVSLLLATDDIGDTRVVNGYDGGPVYDVSATGWDLRHPDGTPITNIQPYGADGLPLEGVRLFDQAGRPIDLGTTHDAAGMPLYEEVIGADGLPVTNVYPARPVAPLTIQPTPTTTLVPPPTIPALPPTTPPSSVP
jgi:hypothetical protein